MAVKNWPKPVRRLIAWVMLGIAVAILTCTSWLLVAAIVAAQKSESGASPWAIVVAHYAMLVTAPVAIAISAAVYLRLIKKGRDPFALYFLVSVMIGVIIGLIMAPLTAGFSLVAAPPFSTLAILLAWLIKPPPPKNPASAAG